MLANRNAMATIAVKDLAAAQKFYEGKLGLTRLADDEEGVLNYQSGTANIVVYVSAFAGTNKATSATWAVGDEFDSIMKTLKVKGVVFEHYDMPGMTLQGDAHVAGDYKGAWFKDPDGNVLHILNR
ncbi:Catechol 2,3-dioxygenase [Polaromonas sp. YR568]|uniref:VOC family protein n=1 Tax=Polaromonas sp. YR568 TaxID=1855301 RepID=UPI0008F41AE8|nr:VOC family protein [Polaromonas sp. YR568]SFV03392.1 Catechol 2,3-dioxygenase [Polaromonas sp. YR568]